MNSGRRKGLRKEEKDKKGVTLRSKKERRKSMRGNKVGGERIDKKKGLIETTKNK